MADRTIILRPAAAFVEGRFQQGLEIELEGSRVRDVRPARGPAEDYALSPAFINAHSHLEYRGLMGQMRADRYWEWIREITERKREQTPEQVQADCVLAARENLATGVALVGEHTDRLGAAAALKATGVGAVLFQEVVTFREHQEPAAKLRQVRERARENAKLLGREPWTALHTPWTVDRSTLEEFGRARSRHSMHLAETDLELEFFRGGQGPIAELYRAYGMPPPAEGCTPFEFVESLGLVHAGAQLVHCCSLSIEECHRLAASGASVAHCPRSNVQLGCPGAPIRELLDAGAPVGLGLDSAASSGPPDMFAEMRAARRVAEQRGKPLAAEEIWRMATDLGARSLRVERWGIEAGSEVPLIRVSVRGEPTAEGLIESGSPADVEWVPTASQA